MDRALAGTIFARKLHYFPETGSTNSLAMEAAAQEAPEGSAFIADAGEPELDRLDRQRRRRRV